MKKQAAKIIFTIAILLLVSCCAGMKPLFQAGTVQGWRSPGAKGYTVTYRFHPSSSRVFNTDSSDLITIQKEREWKVSASLPAKIRYEF